ncbi:unnamed protein product [Calypogeia fissa]
MWGRGNLWEIFVSTSACLKHHPLPKVHGRSELPGESLQHRHPNPPHVELRILMTSSADILGWSIA